MKIVKFFVCSLICFAIIFVSGCSLNVKTILERTSDQQINFFFTSCDFCEIEFYCGQREENFEYDGKSTEKVDYGIIKVEIKQKFEDEFLPINLIFDEQILSVSLEKNPFDGSYMADIEKQINSDCNIKVDFDDDKFQDQTLNCVSKNWSISSQQAISIAGKTLENFLKKHSSNRLDYECYLRVVHNIQDGERLFFYTFLVKTTNLKSANLVINPNDGEVLVKWESN